MRQKQAIVLKQVGCGDNDFFKPEEKTYKVLSLENMTSLDIGQTLTESEVQTYINNGFKVSIKG